mmetsp:Transcript_76574/g.164197  ORF Transcript_76574/g.164197 Transcript_76574/m.164197 type:complete len:739 (-) Transcript_76574:184-2400(-)
MAQLANILLCIAALSCGTAFASELKNVAQVTPVEKVTKLLEDLKDEVTTEGQQEATTYEEFATFCKDKSGSKSKAIVDGKDTIASLSATIGEKTADKELKEADLTERQAKQEELAAKLKAEEIRCAQEKATYEATAADLSKAITSMENAVKALKDAKPSFLEVRNCLAMADALNLIKAPQRRAMQAFLQIQGKASVDPTDPEYKYHSQGIIDVITKLHEEFTAEKKTLDDEWAKTKKVCQDTQDAFKKEMKENKAAMDSLSSAISILKSEIASAREALVTSEFDLKEDQLYLKDLTERCEVRAKDWDQRSVLRADELKALEEALAILVTNITKLDTAVNQRALLQGERHPLGGAVVTESLTMEPHRAAEIFAHRAAGAALSFIQGGSVAGKGLRLGRGRRNAASSGAMEVVAEALSTAARQQRVETLLREESHRLGSMSLASLASHLAADPFEQVKVLIQKLIERLLAEATNEATKKGFCDTELGKATQDRDFRLADAKALNVDLLGLEAKEDELEAEIQLLNDTLVQLRIDLQKATEIRAQEKEENLVTIKQGNEGVEAVAQALTVLQVFYKRAGKATVLTQASPIDEDTAGAGFSGAYRGKQSGSKGIIGILEVIKTDFERTVRTTEAAEKQAAEEFVKFDRTTRSDIGAKETKKALNEEDLITTKNTIVSKTADLTSAMSLLDSALKMLEELKPTCIDHGMSYAERVQKREEEMDALKRALCILDTEGVEEDCAN